MSLGHHDSGGTFHIDGVTGPDEYSAIADDNTYTNLMAGRNLRWGAETAERNPHEAAALGVDHEETASWREAAAEMHLPYDDELGVHEQHAGFTRHQPWDFSSTRIDQYPLLLHFPYFDIYRKQVVKQADWCWRCTRAGSPSTRSTRHATSPTTNPAPCVTPRSPPAARQ